MKMQSKNVAHLAGGLSLFAIAALHSNCSTPVRRKAYQSKGGAKDVGMRRKFSELELLETGDLNLCCAVLCCAVLCCAVLCCACDSPFRASHTTGDASRRCGIYPCASCTRKGYAGVYPAASPPPFRSLVLGIRGAPLTIYAVKCAGDVFASWRTLVEFGGDCQRALNCLFKKLREALCVISGRTETIYSPMA